ncbi:TetR/AcrR family transcriptional regulator [Marispirochaeta sp.]|uniref:TetR/AcrR family transcriptional regulator n=1 Tax=Marispirochaeta sp. TaxID=2038653 RepID=UPI0029C7CD72|nr:TetR/AcrR family transcriptional regulator [Marispirochaeta sp.]
MISIQIDTRQKILDSGKKEFLRWGFKGASMRRIAENAGVTTGAIYLYYRNKEALFDALVREPAEPLLSEFRDIHRRFSSHQPDTQIQIMHEYSEEGLSGMLVYIFEHYTAFKLIVCCSAGTAWETYIDTLVAIEEEATRDFIAILKDRGKRVLPVDNQLIHILASSLFYGLFEIITHDTEQTKAMKYIDSLQEFYRAGWDRLLGLKQ